jgi:hypothetical protein
MRSIAECQANAAECQRNADRAVAIEDKIIWEEMAAHWRYLSPLETSPVPRSSPRPS